MTYRWKPLMGKFEIEGDELKFKGGSTQSSDPSNPDPLVHVGILVANQQIVNGRITATVSFADVNNRLACELILGHDVSTQAQVTAGLGGSGALFSIREWIPGPSSPSSGGGRWSNLQLGGDRSNLAPGVPYELSAEIIGSRVSLDVDGVRVAEATLERAVNKPRQLGVFCLGESDITITGFRATIERPKAFVVMQFSSPYDDLYSHVIKDACQEFDIEAVRADEIYGATGIIIKDVVEQISTCQIVIADISPSNPNVYFEVGYALALNKPIILLAQKRPPDSPLPFDISSFRVLFYDDSIGGKPRLEEGLRNHLRQILGRR